MLAAERFGPSAASICSPTSGLRFLVRHWRAGLCQKQQAVRDCSDYRLGLSLAVPRRGVTRSCICSPRLTGLWPVVLSTK